MKRSFLILFMLIGFQHLSVVQPVNAQSVDTADTVAVDISFTEKTVKTLYETKPYKYITGAVSSVSGEEVANIPGVNRLNVLSGRLPGLLFYSMDGLPGYENSIVRVRGDHTFTGSRNPLVLVDGKVGDYSLFDPYDIESITVLKDAAATAMYGLRGANGLILIETKKGREGRIKVGFNSETSFSQPTRLPKFLDAYNYALLYNEALRNDDPDAAPKYDNTALEAYRTGSDPFKYPNVNLTDEFLKDSYYLIRNNLNISGGSKTANYHVSASHLYNSGVYNTDKALNTYNTNTDINVMNVHGNVHLNIGRNLKLNTDIRAKKEKRNAPGGWSSSYAETLFQYLYQTPFNAYPVKNKDGSLGGTQDDTHNLYGELNLKGYSVWERSSISSCIDASFDLGSVLRGLSIEGQAGFNTYTDYYMNRTKNFAVYQMNADGQTYTQIGLDSELGNSGSYSQIYRNFDHNIGLRYGRKFDRHNIDALLMYDRQQVMNAQSANLAQNYQGPKGSLSYRFDDRYLADFSFACQGSEQYPPNARYGFFPAVALGWIISNENFLKDVEPVVDFLKIRASHGITGKHVTTYFEYLSSFTSGSNAYYFGTTPAGQTGYYKNKEENPALTWEKCRKTNLGIDFTLLQDRFSGVLDLFTENNRDILISNAITGMYGASIYMPEGEFENKGYEIMLCWKENMEDFGYYINADYSFTRNKIINQNEVYREYPWMYRTGLPLSSRFGYVFERYFTEQDDISSLPDQSFLGGKQQPGDLKYKDLNGDNIINDYDQTNIGNTNMPSSVYGMGLGVKYRGIDLNVLFQGAFGGNSYYSSYTYRAFHNRTGNVLEHHLKRWTPNSGQTAEYPRLSLSNTNNTVTSSYWVKDNSFTRLKYVELGYTLPSKTTLKAGIDKARIFLNGYNLFCWDKTGIIDPEMQDDGIDFPVQRSFSIGLNINF
jgi:TonB-linked SusC/RagA family outer membrane protein